jgi:hypothetical protein
MKVRFVVDRLVLNGHALLRDDEARFRDAVHNSLAEALRSMAANQGAQPASRTVAHERAGFEAQSDAGELGASVGAAAAAQAWCGRGQAR